MRTVSGLVAITPEARTHRRRMRSLADEPLPLARVVV